MVWLIKLTTLGILTSIVYEIFISSSLADIQILQHNTLSSRKAGPKNGCIYIPGRLLVRLWNITMLYSSPVAIGRETST